MARLTKAEEEAMAEFEFSFEEPPETDSTRRSKLDPMWDAAKALCEKNPGKSLKVRNYNHASTAYNDAKAINNGEHRKFEGHGDSWLAVAVKNDELLNDKDEPTYDLFLKYTGE